MSSIAAMIAPSPLDAADAAELAGLNPTPLLTIDRLHKRFDDKVILSSIALKVRHGETVVLIGPSGSAKATLRRCITYLEKPDGGSIRLGAERIGMSES